MFDLFMALFQAMLILLGFLYIYGLFLPALRGRPVRTQQIALGVAFGVFGVFNLAQSVVLAPGLMMDIRSPILLLAGIRGRLIGVGITALMMGGYRYVVVGGQGALAGTVAIVGVAAFSLLLPPANGHRYRVRDWLLVGLGSVFISLTAVALIPGAEARQLFIEAFIPSALAFYPLTTLALGLLTQRQQDELAMRQALADSEARFRTMFEGSPAMLTLMDADGRLLRANPAAMAFNQVGPEAAIGRFVWETVNPADIDAAGIQAMFQEALTGAVARRRVRIQNAQGDWRTLDASVTALAGVGETLLLNEAYDVTAELEAEAQRLELAIAQEQNNLLRDFVADAGHHLRTPITVMQSSLYICQRHLNDAQATLQAAVGQSDTALAQANAQVVQDMLQIMPPRLDRFRRALTDLNQLVDDMLALLRYERVSASQQRLDLRDIVQSVVAEFDSAFATQHLTLEVRLPDHPLWVQADDEALTLALRNVLHNALRYSDQGTLVQVWAFVDADRATIAVQDQGIGIATDALPHIFERFYRADNARSVHDRGTGLGLAIVRQCLHAQGGDVGAESRLGEGSTFTLWLPLASAPAAQAAG